MKLTGYEKKLSEYTKEELVQIAVDYSIYYTTATGQGRLSGYERLTKSQLISLISNDRDYKRKNPKNPVNWTTTNRFIKFKESLFGTETPEELMDEIMNLAKDTERSFPVPGKYYTYIYYAVTPGIIYDRHPLVKIKNILPRGFSAFNFHWTKYRQYNTKDGDRLLSGLFELNSKEVQTLRSVPYARKVRI
jgi:hypothetical protein